MKKLNLVLLVDDDEISNFVTEKHIDRSNLVDHLEIKTNGQEAAEYLSNCKNTYPDLVLLDINMPLMSGFELLDHYQQSSYSGNWLLIQSIGKIRNAKKNLIRAVSELSF